MERYVSWSNLRKQLDDLLCESLKGRVTYFFTRYHDVHNAYGRAAILLDGKELVLFSWPEMYKQERAISKLCIEKPESSINDIVSVLSPKWDAECTFCEGDFLNAVLQFRNLAIRSALESPNYIIKILAIMDRRVGKRTLQQIASEQQYVDFPAWVSQFYKLRLLDIM